MKTRMARVAGRYITIVLCAMALACVARADVAYTNSATFSVDTTIPEPALCLLAAGGLALLLRRRGTRKAVARQGLALLALALAALLGTGGARAAAPTVSDVTAMQRTETLLCDIYYTSADADGDMLEVALYVSTNAGATFDVPAPSVSGDVGYVTTGQHKHIIWDMQADFPNKVCSKMQVKVLADDSLRLIPAGTFNMGTNNLPYEHQMSDAGPNHAVYVSAFYMGKYEVSSQEWFAVRNWAVANGYSFDNTGSGKGATHPAQTMSWYDAVKWCNARSQKEGLTPCYYLNESHTVLYKTGQSNLWNAAVNWTATGYRLPSEAEWEKAARGGLSGRRFPWQDLNITHTNANYKSSSSYAYDTSTTRGFHPTFAVGGYAYTSPAGYFAANGYGLYDMAGNVWEWCWDWYGSGYYASSPGSDPRGPASGTYRVLRGGGWDDGANGCRVAVRSTYTPDFRYNYHGFRAVRR